MEYPAINLSRPTGIWRTANYEVREQFAVFELTGEATDDSVMGKCMTDIMEHDSGRRRVGMAVPHPVIGIRLNVPNSEASPRHCSIHYSTSSVDGPWKLGWNFEVPERGCVHDAVHDFSRAPNQFKALLMKLSGTVEDAWRDVMGCAEDAAMDFEHFKMACDMVRKEAAQQGFAQDLEWADEVEALYHYLDGDDMGFISADDVNRGFYKNPRAPWWKLTLRTNWGSHRDLQVNAPVRLYSGVDPTAVIGFRRRSAGGLPDMPTDLTLAFDAYELGLGDHLREMRILAARYGLPRARVEEVYEKFRSVDADGSGLIERAEFEKLLLQLHGASDPSELPASRIRFFWHDVSGASIDPDAAVAFEQFLVWFQRYFKSSDVSSMRRGRSGTILSSFYSAFTSAPTARVLANEQQAKLERLELSARGRSESLFKGNASSPRHGI